MRYLIDGYNLAHASGDLQGKVGPHGLERARNALIHRIATGHSDAPGEVTVAFDAKHAPAETLGEEVVRGIHVQYALREEADDLIERLIRADSVPKKLTVVSSDRRLKDAARRRGCPVMTSGEYLDWLDRPRPKAPGVAPQDKPEIVGPDEVSKWLDAFEGGSKHPGG